jgi:hypothetical protein
VRDAWVQSNEGMLNCKANKRIGQKVMKNLAGKHLGKT